MNTTWTLDEQQYTLHRFPPNQHDKSLQAWDSADELAVATIREQYQISLNEKNLPRVLILDDLFGALSVGLHEFEPTCLLDSYVSYQAIKQNSAANNLPVPAFLWSLDELPTVDLVVIKLTKNTAYLEHHLKNIRATQPNAKVMALGKTTLVTYATLALFEKYLGNVKTSLAKKKSRLIFADVAPKVETKEMTEELKPDSVVTWPEMSFTLAAYANVFSKGSIDIGGRFLAENLESLLSLPSNLDDNESNGSTPYTAIDLGCGNGLLGLSLLKAFGDIKQPLNLIFSDESNMAVQSARFNVQENFPNRMPDCTFRIDDCLSQQADATADLILCNPPFHQQNAITTHIAEQMIKGAFKAMNPKGELYLVANRHLPYQQCLKSTFGGFKVAASNSKFTIYKCQKR